MVCIQTLRVIASWLRLHKKRSTKRFTPRSPLNLRQNRRNGAPHPIKGMGGLRCLFFATALAVYAQFTYTMTADQVVAFIRSSLQLHQDDAKVAQYVRRIRITDKLEERRVEELE